MLKPLEPFAEKDYNVLSLDSEADSNGKTYVWCVWGHYQGKTIERSFTNPKFVVDFLFKRPWIHTILTGVNLDFDLNTLKYRRGFNWDCHYNMGQLIFVTPPKKVSERYGKRTVKIIELGNWILNTSLQGMCKMFGIEGHIDEHILNHDKSNLKLMHQACMSHAMCGVLVFERLQNQFHSVGAKLGLTASSTSMDIFRRHYLKDEHIIYDYTGCTPEFFGLPRDASKEQTEVARKEFILKMKADHGRAYYGGRCEMFKKGTFQDVDCIDINSSYPHEMRDIILPNLNAPHKWPNTQEGLNNALERSEGIAHVTVSIKNMLIPILPFLDEESHRLIFPIGEFSGWWTFPELRTAIEYGYKIKEVFQIYAYEPVEGMFTEFIDEMYKIKATKSTKQVGKLVMNGLSGKWGQQVPDESGYQIYEGTDPNILQQDNFFDYRGIVYEYISKEVLEAKEYVRTAYPILSAYILGNARLHLWHTMRKIGFDKVYYSDTDSIYADHTAIQTAVDKKEIDIDPIKLGAWDIEGQHGRLETRGLKMYQYSGYTVPGDTTIHHKYAMKGISGPKNQRRFWNDRQVTIMRPQKIRTAIRKGDPVNLFVPVHKIDRFPSPKRNFSVSGASLPIKRFI